MNNTNQHLYSIYENIQSFYGYRKLVSIDSKLNQDQFIKLIQKDRYIILSAVSKADADRTKITKDDFPDEIMATVILLVYPGTDCESKRANMLKLVNHIPFKKHETIIITPTKISAGVNKGLLSIMRDDNNQSFKAFTYTLFNSVLPEHELVPSYEILSHDQIEGLKNWFIEPDTLPKIFENDPQMVWIGAKIGDVVKFTFLSEVTINAIGYCKVIPSL
jgi:DNA-directed RNA polymerase subunit H (RpoH/RPB5)